MKQRLLKLFPFQRGVLNECAENSSCELFSESVYCLKRRTRRFKFNFLSRGVLLDNVLPTLVMKVVVKKCIVIPFETNLNLRVLL
jgi:hypothetical protein